MAAISILSLLVIYLTASVAVQRQQTDLCCPQREISSGAIHAVNMKTFTHQVSGRLRA